MGKNFVLGSVGDRVVNIKRCVGGHMVIIKVKNAENKFVELPPKR